MAAMLPMHEHWLPLSNLDKLLPPVDVSVFFCYRNPIADEDCSLTTFGSTVSIQLKKSMAQTLAAYYAFAGEILLNTMGEPELYCNNRGVDFVEAFADVELRNLNLYNPDDSVEGKLVPKKKQGVLSVQVTELKCGGLIVGCTFDHRVADAYSANMFLTSWAEVARSEPLSQLPSFCRSWLNPRRSGYYDPCIKDMYICISSLPPPKELQLGIESDQLITRIYYIEANRISQLQALASIANCKRTKLEAFSAFLWKVIALSPEDVRVNKMCRQGNYELNMLFNF